MRQQDHFRKKKILKNIIIIKFIIKSDFFVSLWYLLFNKQYFAEKNIVKYINIAG